MNTTMKAVKLADRIVVRVTRWGVILAMSILFLLLLARVTARATEIPFAAYDEIVELATIWLIILGTLSLWREGMLYRVSVVTDVFPRFGHWIEVLVQMVMLAFALMLVWVGGQFTAMNREVTAFMQIDMTYYYGAIPSCGAVMTIYSAVALFRTLHGLVTGRAQRACDDLGDPKSGPAANHL